MKKTLIFGILLIAIVGIPIAKKYLQGEDIKEVETEVVGPQTIKASILASGRLKHEQEVKLTSEVIGRVSQVYVKEGDHVSAGETVLEIDDQAYAAAVNQQRAVVDQQRVAIDKQRMIVANLEKQWNRKTRLHGQKLLDTDSYDLITHEYQVAKIDLKAAFETLKQFQARLDQTLDQLSKTKIVSPINGKVTSLDIKVGETAISSATNIAGSSLMTIANPASMLAEINVDEADIANVAIGQKAEIIAISFANRAIHGIVDHISSSAKPAIGRQSLSFAVKLKLQDNDKLSLRPGMSCRAEIFTQGEQELLAVPLKAIQTLEDNDNNQVENFVYVVVDNTASKRKIVTGISDDSFQQIVEGVKKGVTVITGPDKTLRHLKEGERITIKMPSDDKI